VPQAIDVRVQFARFSSNSHDPWPRLPKLARQPICLGTESRREPGWSTPLAGTGMTREATALVRPTECLEALAIRVKLQRTEWRVLAIVLSSPARVSASTVAKRLHLDYGFVKRVVRELAQWNIVERTSSGLAFQPDHTRWGPPLPHEYMTSPNTGASPSPRLERLLTLKEAADVLRLHPRTVREFVRRGELQGRVIGRRWRFRRKDLEAFFDNAAPQWQFYRKPDHVE
jgi:excisionase family DNA binding protein